ncbi:glycosyltransferase family 4 protein [Roseospira marina]|uniref:glycosyltransferase family 4 protein n=1 Tax=Roseospira marina TaxID=140057 RepID=UPI00147884F2|nr:glycosyltransferase family 4 protein [Roseospira marina]MBB4313491.1 glycosyltransferase involved in cell wall biosynthesis [Roseospira marina]MBB5086653.1 glycosyltransferase involved in cell wall biosynthesis [Roseospira marina]
MTAHGITATTRRETQAAGAIPTVLQVLPALEAGGVERGTVDVAEGIVGAGWRALVASQGGRLEHALARVGARHITLPLATKNPLALRRNAGRLARVIREHGVDLIHARSRAPAWSALWASRATGVPLVTTFHGTYTLGPWGLKAGYNRVMIEGARVIAISQFIAAHIREQYGVTDDRIRIIPRGVDLTTFTPQAVREQRIVRLATQWRLPEDATVILMPGRLTRWKGQSLLIEAMARLGRPGVHALIVGSDQGRAAYRTTLDDQIAHHGLEGQVHILDHCDDMPAAYRLANVVVSASLEPEAFGRVPAEGQALGRVVVAPAHGGALEIVDHGVTGWLFEPGDADSLAYALAVALDMDPAARTAMTERAMVQTQRVFSKTAMILDTLAVYRELLGAPEPALSVP